jgi:hypothetical protein
MRAVALCALVLGGCLDFDSLPSRFMGDLATDDADAGTPDMAVTPMCPGTGPITFVDQASVEQGMPLTKTLIVPRPPSVQACDVMILMFFADLNSVITDPPGWNKFVDLPSSKNFDTRYYWRTANDSEPSTYSVMMDPEQFAAASIVAYRGVDPISPIEGSLQSVCHTPPTTISGFTPQHQNTQTVLACLCDTGFGLNPNFSSPSGMTLRALSIATGVWDAPQPSGAVPQQMLSCATSSDLCCVEMSLHSTP